MISALANSVQEYRTLCARLLRDMPELKDDPECLLDTLDGITDTKEEIAALVNSALDDEATVVGLDARLKALVDRRAYLQERAKRKRAVALNYMSDLGFKNIKTLDVTISRRFVPPSVMIIDEKQIPDAYMRIKKEPNKVIIKEALAHGDFVPGAALSNGSETLTVKV